MGGNGAMSPEEFAKVLDQYVSDHHPFIHSRWSQQLLQGKLGIEHLRGFALEFEHFLRAAPRHFFCVGANCPDVIPDDFDMRRKYAENIMDDLGVNDREQDHFEIHRRFAYAIGLTKEELDRSTPAPFTVAFNCGILYLAKHLPYEEGLAAIGWAQEGLFYLGMADRFADALKQHFGLRQDQLFLPPTEQETEHSGAVRRAVLEYAITERNQRRLLEVFKTDYDCWTVFFDGLYYRDILHQ
ncbi:MAG: iron-containing redox enzyme family protein [Deltaproteobacteria bacterium]|nr:iron-containing redox enzyme family protein [Deltaproteobacteria bacterium]